MAATNRRRFRLHQPNSTAIVLWNMPANSRFCIAAVIGGEWMETGWSAALGVIVDYQPMTYWRMTNGAEFWWTLSGRHELLADRFAEQPFRYAEIESLTVYREARAGREVWACDWLGLCEALACIRGIRLAPLAGVRPWPSSPPTDALVLVADPEPHTLPTGGRDSPL